MSLGVLASYAFIAYKGIGPLPSRLENKSADPPVLQSNEVRMHAARHAVTSNKVVAEFLERRVLLCDEPVPGASVAAIDPARATGDKDLLYMIVQYAGQAPPQAESTPAPGDNDAQEDMAFLERFMRDNSYGLLRLHTHVLTVQIGAQSLYADHEAVRTAARAKACEALQISMETLESTYQFEMYRTSKFDTDTKDGHVPVGGIRFAWIHTDQPHVPPHELGHLLGLDHANAHIPVDRDTIIGAAADPGEYGNPFDMMNNLAQSGSHFNVGSKNALNWIPTANVYTIGATPQTGEFTIFPFDFVQPNDPAAPRVALDSTRRYAISIPSAATGAYWIGFRQHELWTNPASSNFNPGLTSGVEITRPVRGVTELLDLTPWTATHEDAALRVGRTFIDPASGVEITPKRKNTDGSITVQVSISNNSATAPAVGSLSAVQNGFAATLNASISDSDGGDLAYYWDFGDGAFAGGALAIPNGNGNQQAITASHTWVSPADYRVRLTITDMTGHTTSKSIMVPVGAFPAVRVFGRAVDVFGNPLQDVRVAAATTAYTDSDGSYTLSLLPGSSTFSASKPGWTFTTPGFSNPLGVGPDTVGVDFRGTFGGYSITGRVTSPAGAPLPGVLVSRTLQTQTVQTELTDAAGTFRLSGLDNGVYTVAFAKSGYSFPQRTVTINYNSTAADVVAAGTTYTVSGTIQGTPAGELSANVFYGARMIATNSIPRTFELTVEPGTWNLSAVGINGVYFDNLVPSGGWTNPLVVNGNKTAINFTYDPTKFSVRGRITDGGQPLAGVTVTAASGFSTVTDAEGSYAISGMPAGNYTVTPTLAGKSFSPASRQFSGYAPGSDFQTTNPPPNADPTVPSPAVAEAISGSWTGRWLTIGGDDDGGANRLKYTWSVASSDPVGLPEALYPFVRNGTNSAKHILATFTKAGTYVMQAEVKDERDGVYHPTPNDERNKVTIVVSPTLSSVHVRPATIADPGWIISTIAAQTPLRFLAESRDQFGYPMPTQPPGFTWSSAGGGAPGVTQQGIFTSGSTGNFESVVASTGTVRGSATVFTSFVGRRLFYNRSHWDGSTASVPDGANDYAAIDTSKSALLPGQLASFANYTSFNKGINGLIVDVSQGPNVISASDFEFKAGNSADPSTWTTVPTPVVAFRPGEGDLLRHRVLLTWPDGTIANTWLQVTVRANANTELSVPDVFYFGNLIGDTNVNPTGQYATLADDYSRTKAAYDAAPNSAAAITSLFDHNRDGILTTDDYQIVQNNFFATLLLLSAPI